MRIRRFATRVQNRSWDRGRNVIARCLDMWRRGTKNRIRTEAARARTPPSLLGIDRRIAYANRKYHSGLMCGGVTSGFAGEKFSGSPRRLGENIAKVIKGERRRIKPRVSFMEK